jgi:hypothetical protein
MTADSRTNHWISTLDSFLEGADEMQGEKLNPHDAVKLEMAEKMVATAIKNIASMSIYSPVVGVEPAECGKYSSLGSLCVQPAGHTDTHLSAYGSKWTDESDRKSAAAIAKSMEGKRD